MKYKILNFYDNEIKVNFLIETELSESALQKEVNTIISNFNHTDWHYEGILYKLVELKLIKYTETSNLYINA